MRCRFRAAIRESNILQTESSQALIVVGGRLPPIDAPSARYEALHIGGGSTDRAPPCARHAHLPDFRAKKSFSTCGRPCGQSGGSALAFGARGQGLIITIRKVE